MKAFRVRDSDLDRWARVYRLPVEPLKRGEIEAEPERSFREIAVALNVTPQRAQQIQRNAIAKCRKWCAEHGLELSDLLELR